MKNIDVIDLFNKGLTGSSENLESTGDRLYSYSTCIAQRKDDGIVYINNTKYSTTTSKHQNLVLRICTPHVVLRCTSIPRGIVKLNKYIDNEI